MARLLYRVYQSGVDNPKLKNKFFARIVHTETLDLEALAEHIAEHGSPYTEDVVYGVLKRFSECMLEMLQESKKVKIPGLGTFYLSAQTVGADSSDEFSPAENIRKIRIRFLPERVKDKLTGTRLRSEVNLVNVSSLLGTASSSSSGSGSGSNDDEPVVENPD